MEHQNAATLRVVGINVSMIGSPPFGCVFMSMKLVDLVQIILGDLNSWSSGVGSFSVGRNDFW
ncbi:hypothetical protein I3843_14G064900 [Carya illinoinensis]|nr:hypothetical protein I3843_14G064900 [Carya illinoinensis]